MKIFKNFCFIFKIIDTKNFCNFKLNKYTLANYITDHIF